MMCCYSEKKLPHQEMFVFKHWQIYLTPHEKQSSAAFPFQSCRLRFQKYEQNTMGASVVFALFMISISLHYMCH